LEGRAIFGTEIRVITRHSGAPDNAEKHLEPKRGSTESQIDLLSVLQMQSRWTGARATQVNIKNQRLAQRIDLHLALGGSFETDSQ
jgi:hypothetical protein